MSVPECACLTLEAASVKNPMNSPRRHFLEKNYQGFGIAKGTHSNRHCIDFWFKHFLDH
jgi:hypothetical protein